MSTRSKTRSATASVMKIIPPETPKLEKKSKKRSHKSESAEKENVEGKASRLPEPKKKKLRSSGPVYCTCQNGDDGSPMVHCEECKLWYHFSCIDLKEEDAEEINVYICPACTKASGRRTAMHWEGPDAIEEVSENEANIGPAPKKQRRVRERSPVDNVPSETEEDPSSADEYIGDSPKVKGKRPIRRLSYSSHSDSEVSNHPKQHRRHRIHKQATPPAAGGLKRKIHTSQTPPLKRKKSEGFGATDDPTRKYCLGKLEELFHDIFSRYPHVRVESRDGDDHDQPPETAVVKKSLDSLTEDEKAALLNESKHFAMELEGSIFEIYSEPDKESRPSAGSKYKDRFRMLQFNLSKPDRVVLHQRIVSALITPEEISLMSSTDLANEETKESIKIAEKEALEHSILTPTAVPRAKITHKGLEDIEDIHGQAANAEDDERSRREEDERRERERMARLRAQARQRAESTSVPPESPVTPHEASPWGEPPAIPLHPILNQEPVAAPMPKSPFTQTSAPTLLPAPPGTSVQEPELNLSDFINIDIDDDTSLMAENASISHPPPAASEGITSHSVVYKDASRVPPTGISPFAAKQEASQPSFDLDALWNKPTVDESPTAISQPPHQRQPSTASPVSIKPDYDKHVIMESRPIIADDHDFDMFLEEKLDSTAASAEAQQVALDVLPQVWSGKINMPLDSTIPQETPVVARQIGGRPIQHDSALWKTLFPSELLRIDGRVPVENSSKFLLHVRMNVTKELVAVAFSPASQSNDVGFRFLSDFLIAKGRHGLVFPWGNRPKDHHPGRELYIIPLLSSDPLPEYMELLDNLHLPKLRKANLLIGVWVLNKGKLLPPPPQSPMTAYPPLPRNIQIPFSATLQQPTASSTPNPPPLPANIAAEVASLTPEQIQLMIQTLTGNRSLPLPLSIPQPPQPPPAPQNPPVQIPPSQPYPRVAPQWSHPVGAVYPPLPALHATSHDSPPLHRDPPLHSHFYDRHDSRESCYRPDRDREDRGGRNWRGRGRGRSGGNDSPRKPVDSGWPRRPRPDGGSPPRRW